MDQNSLVNRRIDDGQKLLLQLTRDNFDVATAFWLKAPEDAWAHLFIASRVVDQVGPGEAYRALQTSLERLPGLSISLAEIKLISVSNPLTSAARKLQRGAQGAVQLRGGQVGALSVEEAYLYPPFSRQKRSSVSLGKVRLQQPVEQTSRLDVMLAPLSQQESRALEQLVTSGVSPTQADYWVRKKREETREKQPIPAGTVVNARVAAWWGDNPEDDPNPLLLVEAPDGAQGLTFKNNTEPV
jgi:hypothetical protein